MGKKAALHNLGCKVNAYETEAMRQLLEKDGYEIVPFAPGADVYVINTCTVTGIADRKSRQMLHRARKMNPEAIVVAAGCYVQTARQPVEEDEAVDIILGNNCKKDLIEALHEFEKTRSGASFSDKIDIDRTHEYETLSISRSENRTRADVKVQDGCNQFCSYCLVPYARGRARSRALPDILKEVRTLCENGCREIVLTGIHLSSYGCDLGLCLADLICAVHDIPSVERIRLGSLEPGIVTDEFAGLLAGLPKLCPHFHLSLQSGSTAVLKRMNRQYTAEEFEERCGILRRAFDHPALTTDVIVGFPGETPEEFSETEAFLERLSLYETHIFKYSRRQGTRAAALPDQVSEQEKQRRSERLIALGDKNRIRFEQECKEKEAEVLFEEKTDIGGRSYYAGYTKEYIRAAVPADRDYANRIARGKLGEALGPHLFLMDALELF